jgi:hypothetical protein
VRGPFLSEGENYVDSRKPENPQFIGADALALKDTIDSQVKAGIFSQEWQTRG